MRMTGIPAININATNVAQILQQACIKYPAVAHELTGKNFRLRSDVSARYVKDTFSSVFNSKGQLRPTAKKLLSRFLKASGLEENATVIKVVKAIRKMDLGIDLNFTEKELKGL